MIVFLVTRDSYPDRKEGRERIGDKRNHKQGQSSREEKLLEGMQRDIDFLTLQSVIA